MTRLTGIVLAAALTAAPVSAIAQESTAEDGFNLIEEGAKLLLRGLSEEIEPMMQDLAIEMEPQLRAFAEDLLPMLEDFSDIIGDLDQYQMPEKLPNGDIILRRKTPDEETTEKDEDGEVDI